MKQKEIDQVGIWNGKWWKQSTPTDIIVLCVRSPGCSSIRPFRKTSPLYCLDIWRELSGWFTVPYRSALVGHAQPFFFEFYRTLRQYKHGPGLRDDHSLSSMISYICLHLGGLVQIHCSRTLYIMALLGKISTCHRVVKSATFRMLAIGIKIVLYRLNILQPPALALTTKWNDNYLFTSSYLYIFMPPPLGAGGIMFSGCPSVRPSVRSLKYPLLTCTWVRWSTRPTVTVLRHVRSSVRLSVRPSVRPERFPGICRRMHGGIGLKFYLLMYLDHRQNWLVYGRGLLIFLILFTILT